MNKRIVITGCILAICGFYIFLPTSSYAYGSHNSNNRSADYHSKHYRYGNQRHYDNNYKSYKNIMVVTVTNIDSITQDVTDIISVENSEITVTVIISAISVVE